DKIKNSHYYKVVRSILPANTNRWKLSGYIIICIIVILLTLYNVGYKILPSPESDFASNETFTFTYNRPIGGDHGKIQKVKLYCFTGPSKGVTNGDIWCQEVIDSEWSGD